MADGYLNFDTSINTKGFTNGVKMLSKKFIGSAADMKAAFDMVAATINKITASFAQMTEAYRTQIEAEARLAATMKNSTSASEAQIQSVKDLASSLQELGVVGDEVQLAGAQELATYVENAESIKKMLPVLNDMIAQQYGFSASTDSAVTIATMLGKVLQGQTSALSRYGYKFDEAQEQLLKYGTEQQRVATLAAVVEESVAGVNQALAETPTGKVKQLSNDFGDLKETAGKLLTEVAYPLVVKLDVIVKKLNEVFTAASSGVKALFGIKDTGAVGGLADSSADIDDSTAEAAESYADIAKSAKQAEKANKGSLAAFDELNVLSKEIKQDDEEPLLLPETDTSGFEVPVTLGDSVFEQQLDSFIEKIKEKISKIKTFLQPAKAAIERFVKAFEPIGEHVGEGLKWFYDKVLKPFGKWSAGEAFPAFVDMLSGFFTLVDKVGGVVGSTLKTMWDKFFSKVVSWAGDKIVSFLETLGQVFNDIAASPEAVTAIVVIAEVIGTIAAAIVLISGALQIISGAKMMWTFLSGMFVDVGAIVTAVLSPMSILMIALIAIGVVIVEIIAYKDTLIEFGHMVFDYWSNKITETWDKLKNGAKKAWEGVKSVFSKVGDFFSDVFSTAWNKVKEIFSKGGAIFKGIKDGIVTAFKAIVNSLIDGINNVVSIPFEGINNALAALRGIEIIGKTPFEWLPEINIPQIPHLAQGTVIPANYGEFAAILGDNRREAEVVSPVSAIEQAVENVLARRGISGGGNGDIVVQIDGREVFRATRREAENYSRTHGGRPAFGGA